MNSRAHFSLKLSRAPNVDGKNVERPPYYSSRTAVLKTDGSIPAGAPGDPPSVMQHTRLLQRRGGETFANIYLGLVFGIQKSYLLHTFTCELLIYISLNNLLVVI